MSTPTFVNDDCTITCIPHAAYQIGGDAHSITFMNANYNNITVTNNRDTLMLNQGATSTVIDHGKGTHIGIDPWTYETTIVDFQRDTRGVIDVWGHYGSQADIASHLIVVPGVGTELIAQYHGPTVMTFQGDYNVNPNQIHFHAS